MKRQNQNPGHETVKLGVSCSFEVESLELVLELQRSP